MLPSKWLDPRSSKEFHLTLFNHIQRGVRASHASHAFDFPVSDDRIESLSPSEFFNRNSLDDSHSKIHLPCFLLCTIIDLSSRSFEF